MATKKTARKPTGLARTYPYYLANAAVAANTDLEVRDKYSGKVATRVAMGDAAAIRKAIVAAHKARGPMADFPPDKRRDVLEHCVRRFEERFDDLALALCIEAGKPIAAVCHGAQLLAAAGILEGRECSAYPACAPEVRLAGGTFIDIAVTDGHVQGNLATAPAWPAHPSWLAGVLGLLGTQITL